jgi:hypothetical protein
MPAVAVGSNQVPACDANFQSHASLSLFEISCNMLSNASRMLGLPVPMTRQLKYYMFQFHEEQ